MKIGKNNLNDQVLFYDLLEQENLIYDMMQMLFELECAGLNNTNQTKNIVNYLGVHFQKEKRILDTITTDYLTNETIIARLENHRTLAMHGKDYKQAMVADRAISQLAMQYDIQIEDEEGEIITDDGQKILSTVIQQMYLEYLVYLQNQIDKEKDFEQKRQLQKSKYQTAFLTSNVGSELHFVNYNVHNLLILSDDTLAKTVNFSTEEYREIKQNVLYDYIQNILLELISIQNIDEMDLEEQENFEEGLRKFSFILSQLDTARVVDIFDLCEYQKQEDIIIESENRKQLFNRLDIIINDELKKRHPLPSRFIEKNVPCDTIEYETFDTLSSLVKLEENILDIYLKFSDLNFNNPVDKKDLLHKLEHYLAFETELANQFIIDNDQADELLETLAGSLDLFFTKPCGRTGATRKKQLILRRLSSVVPDLFHSTPMASITPKSYNSIIQNHLLKTIYDFNNCIDKISDTRTKQISKEILYEEFFAEESLSQDFVSIGGNPSMIIWLENDTAAQLSNTSEIEYAYDKNEQLYYIARSIIEELLNWPDVWSKDPYLIAYFNFKIHEIKNIFENINDEHYYELIDDFQSMVTQIPENTSAKKKLSRQLKRNLSFHEHH